jgi:5-methylcytosine-specific restriction endonuclease McrA
MLMPTITLHRKKPEITLNKKVYQEIYSDPRWISIRTYKTKENPLCEKCEELGIVTIMDEVHHKIPFQKGKTAQEIERLAFDIDNVISVCASCHHKLHQGLRYKNY